jgi:hypothetical protein
MDFKFILQLLSFIYPNRKDLLIHGKQIYDSKFGRISLKIIVTSAFLLFVYYYFLIFGLIWLKFELSMNGFLIGVCSFVVLSSVTVLHFDSAFHDLFFTKKNKYKPFTIA